MTDQSITQCPEKYRANNPIWWWIDWLTIGWLVELTDDWSIDGLGYWLNECSEQYRSMQIFHVMMDWLTDLTWLSKYATFNEDETKYGTDSLKARAQHQGTISQTV